MERANFTFLKESTGTSDGNLSTHLTKLEESGFITIEKMFRDKKPQTICAISEKGRAAFKAYLEQLEQILAAQKEKI